ncbi:unnamed protein product [Boreogadus saida]
MAVPQKMHIWDAISAIRTLTPQYAATIRAQVEKKRDYSLPHTSTLPLSDTQIADSPQPWSDAQATIRAQVEKKTCISRISPSLKLTLPLKNRFLPLQESTNAPATHAPLSPEMHPDGQCGQRRNNNQSPLRRAEKKRDYSLPHTCTLPLSDTQIADSPQTLKRDNSPPDAINTVLRGVAGLARNDHPPPLHYLQPHLSNSPPDAISTVLMAGLAGNDHPLPLHCYDPPRWCPGGRGGGGNNENLTGRLKNRRE